MADTELERDLAVELTEIPPEYQDTFRQSLTRELAETEQNKTDTDILTYLRRRRDDFKRGGFIRPDGRPGMVTVNAETMYEQALPELVRSSLVESENTPEQTRTLVKSGAFVALVLLFGLLLWRGRAQRMAAAELHAAATPAVVAPDEATPLPTPSLPEITGVDDSLQTIGGLGGALTIGRPSAIELHYASGNASARGGETIALAIDPSKPSTKGEMRFNEAAMLSDNPVAVWLFGTVLNYAIGIPDSMVRHLAPGDRITLSTDTGASLRFVVAETGQSASYEAGRLLSQSRLGLTLFALPASAETEVSFAVASYDITGEEKEAPRPLAVGKPVPLAAGSEARVEGVQVGMTDSGAIRVVLNGTASGLSEAQTIMLGLTAGRQQTTAVSLTPDMAGAWEAAFTLAGGVSADAPVTGASLWGHTLLAEFRLLPGGAPVLVDLGSIPDFMSQLEIEPGDARWDARLGQVVMALSVHNAGEGAVYLDSQFIQLLTEGGDVNDASGQVQANLRLPEQVAPPLPFLMSPGQTMALTVSFGPRAASARLQVGTDLWEVSGIPMAMLSP